MTDISMQTKILLIRTVFQFATRFQSSCCYRNLIAAFQRIP